jgi:hypothetical protein
MQTEKHAISTVKYSVLALATTYNNPAPQKDVIVSLESEAQKVHGAWAPAEQLAVHLSHEFKHVHRVREVNRIATLVAAPTHL